MPAFLSRRQALATLGTVMLAGCAQDPRFARQENAPANLRQGKAYVALDVHEYADGGLFPGRKYNTVATFANVALGKDPLYFPADAWALFSTNDSHHPDDILTIEAGTYRLTVLGTDTGPTFFGLQTSPVEFTVRPGELVYLGALQWHRQKTSSILDYQPSYHFEFAVADEREAHAAALQQAAALLPGTPQIQTQLMTIRTPSLDLQGHRPSLW